MTSDPLPLDLVAQPADTRDDSKRWIIFAGSYQQALTFAHQRGIFPAHFTYAADRWRLAGLNRRDFNWANIGTWQDNPEVSLAYQYWMERPE